MYNEQIEQLINAALADGVLTEKEKQILFKKAQGMGIDLDEFEMVLDARLVELQKAEKEKAEKSAPKSNKYGDVRKCPVCGALIPALSGTCPECGYEFSGVDGNLSSKQLADKIDSLLKEASEKRKYARDEDKIAIKIDYDKRIKQLIINFPIPNTKSDLFEFISSMQARMRGNKFSPTYRRKIKECVIKAQTLFPNDPAFTKLYDEVECQQKKIKLTYIYSIVGVVVVLFCAIGLPLILQPRTPEKNAKVCIEMVNTAISEGNLSNASRLIESYEKSSNKIYAAYDALLNEYVKYQEGYQVKSLIRTYISKQTEPDGKTHYVRFYNDLINVGEYNEAELYLELPEKSLWNGNSDRYEAYYKYLSESVNNMCYNGHKKEAKKWINSKIGFYQGEDRKLYDGNPNPWYPDNVKTRLNQIINAYSK